MNLASTAASTIGLTVGVLLLVVFLTAGIAFAVIVIANRADPDPSGRRPYVVYLFGASFITIWTALIGSAAVVSSLVELIGRTTSLSLGARHPVGDSVARGVVLGGLILLVSLITFVFHESRGRSLVSEESSPSAPSLRVARSYGAAVSFVAVFVLIIALISGLYDVFRLIAPGVFQGRGRVHSVRSIIDAGWVALVSAMILMTHVRMAAPNGSMSAPSTVVIEEVIVVEEPTTEPT